jgi:uncharacterized membrane protein
MPSANWWYAVDGKQTGPVSENELRDRIRQGRLTSSDLVWEPSFGDQWRPIGEVPGLTGDTSRVLTDSFRPVDLCPNAELMRQARERLVGCWGVSAGVLFINWAIGAVAGIIPLLPLILGGPMTLGVSLFFLGVARQGSSLDRYFDGFKQFGQALATFLLMVLLLIGWFLLLIVPGFVKCYSYAMTFYILADDPAVQPLQAITRSRQMMDGRKAKLFCLHLRFFGWAMLLALVVLGAIVLGAMLHGCAAVLLGVLTGLAAVVAAWFWLTPWFSVSTALFYEDIRGRVSDGQRGSSR